MPEFYIDSEIKEESPVESLEEKEDDVVPGVRGVSDLWSSVNHVAIVVSDVGRSLQFYTDVVGCKQILRPNFDRHGAWLSLNNLDLHLIKGMPAVHPDDDLIVSHVAIAISDMATLRHRLAKWGVQSRKNVSVPNPETDGAVVDQAFVRDPDGYYIEFCNCASLEEYIQRKMSETESQKWNFIKTTSLAKARRIFKQRASDSKLALERRISDQVQTDLDLALKSASISDEHAAPPEVDDKKLQNLIKRRKVYGDIAQNATENELEQLLKRFHNHVPDVIDYLERKVQLKGSKTYIPPAFFDRDGTFHQPPSFEMPISLSRHNSDKSIV